MNNETIEEEQPKSNTNYCEDGDEHKQSLAERLRKLLPNNIVVGSIMLYTGTKHFETFAAEIGFLGKTKYKHNRFIRWKWRIYLAAKKS